LDSPQEGARFLMLSLVHKQNNFFMTIKKSQPNIIKVGLY